MDMASLVALLQNTGVSVAVIAYFLYKDYKKDTDLTGAVNGLNSTMNLIGERLSNVENNCNRNIETMKDINKAVTK